MNWIDANKLALNVDKNNGMLIGSRHKLNGIENFDVMVNGLICFERGQGCEVSWCFN